MNDYYLKLTKEEIQLILQTLFDQPFKEVYELIGKINEQLLFQESNNEANINHQ